MRYKGENAMTYEKKPLMFTKAGAVLGLIAYLILALIIASLFIF